MVQWTYAEPWPPATDAEIEAYEAELGVRLPRDFVEVARAHPHAEPEPASLDIPGYGGTAVDCLLHFHDDHRDNLLSRRWLVQDGLGEGLVPFALDIGGDLYCFDYRAGAEAPRGVGYWSVSTGYLPLADSFTAFVGLLHRRDSGGREPDDAAGE